MRLRPGSHLGAVTLAFRASLRYSAGDPRGALHLLDGALADRRRFTSPLVLAMLHARAGRAHSKAGEPLSAWQQVDAACTAYGTTDVPEADLPSMYWITNGELHQVAASSALSLGEPKRALQNFRAALTHDDPYDTAREVRATVIHQVRRADAHSPSATSTPPSIWGTSSSTPWAVSTPLAPPAPSKNFPASSATTGTSPRWPTSSTTRLEPAADHPGPWRGFARRAPNGRLEWLRSVSRAAAPASPPSVTVISRQRR